MRPMVRLKPLIHSLTRMDAISTATVSQLNITGVGCSTLTTDSFSSEKPMPRMVTLTTSPPDIHTGHGRRDALRPGPCRPA